MIPAEDRLRAVIGGYQKSFSSKAYCAENEDHDVLMDAFGLLTETKRENKQYWGRELGMCWQLIVTELFQHSAKGFGRGYREGADELCDLIADGDAIDTKYRIGSGDAGTLKKFKQYGRRLTELGFRPVVLILREDNLPNAVGACVVGGWTVLTAAETFAYIEAKTGVDLKAWLVSLGEEFHITR